MIKFIKFFVIIILSTIAVILVFVFLSKSANIDVRVSKDEDEIYKVVFLMVEGFDYNFYLNNSENFPHLSKLWSQPLVMPKTMDPVAAFYFLSTGQEQTSLWPQLSDDYQADWQQMEIFAGKTFWQKVEEQNKKVYQQGINWLGEQQLKMDNFSAKDILNTAKESFIRDKADILQAVNKHDYDIVVAKVNYLLSASHFLPKEELLGVYKEIDGLVGGLYEALNNNELLLFVSPFGVQGVKYIVDTNNVLVSRGWLLEDNQMIDFTNSYAYSLAPGNVSINLKGREKNGFVEEKRKIELSDDVAFSIQTIENVINNILFDVRIFEPSRLAGNKIDLTIGLPVDYGFAWQDNLDIGDELVVINHSDVINDYWGVNPENIPGVVFSNKIIKEQLNFGNFYDIVVSLLGL